MVIVSTFKSGGLVFDLREERHWAVSQLIEASLHQGKMATTNARGI